MNPWRGFAAGPSSRVLPISPPLIFEVQGRIARMTRSSLVTALLFLAAASTLVIEQARAGQPIVPGTGEFLKDCCDDFEDPKWSYKFNLPKSSHEQDKQQRS